MLWVLMRPLKQKGTVSVGTKVQELRQQFLITQGAFLKCRFLDATSRYSHSAGLDGTQESAFLSSPTEDQDANNIKSDFEKHWFKECCAKVILPFAVLQTLLPTIITGILDGIKCFTFIKTIICKLILLEIGELEYSLSSMELFSFNICAVSSISQEDCSKLYF